MKNKKKSIIIIISLAIISIISITAITINKKNEAIKKAETTYIENVNSFNDQVSTSGINLEKIQSKISKNWYDSIWSDKHNGSIDKAYSNALKNNATLVATTYNEKETIDELYLEIKKLPGIIERNEDLQEVKEKARLVYDDYVRMHDIVLDPSGKNYAQYNDSANTIDDSLASNLSSLTNLLK